MYTCMYRWQVTDTIINVHSACSIIQFINSSLDWFNDLVRFQFNSSLDGINQWIIGWLDGSLHSIVGCGWLDGYPFIGSLDGSLQHWMIGWLSVHWIIGRLDGSHHWMVVRSLVMVCVGQDELTHWTIGQTTFECKSNERLLNPPEPWDDCSPGPFNYGGFEV